MQKDGVTFSGPTCNEKNGKFIISYDAEGTSIKTGKTINEFTDFEVNSLQNEINAITPHAEKMYKLLTHFK